MKIEFDSARDSAIDAAAIAQAMMIYVQNAAGQQQAQTGNQFTASAPVEPTPDPFQSPSVEELEGDTAAPGTVDSRGFPWDERIHAKTRDGGGTLNADGTWRGKRGVSKELVAQVEAELKPQPPIGAAIPATVEAYEAVMTPPPAAPIVPAPVEVPQPPVTVTPPPPPAAPVTDTFESFFAKLTSAQAGDPALMQRAVAAAAEMGINLAGLAARPDLIPEIKAKLGMA